MADENAEPKKLPQRNYGKVIISLENCIFDREKLKTTASKVDGLDLNTEINLRILGCEYIQTAGILLRLPQVAMATAQVLFQRFYYSKSFVKHNMEIVSMACINVASKIEEAPRRLRDVVNVFYHIKQKSMNKPIEPMILDGKYITLKNNVIKAERRVLKELGFSVHVKHPHKMIVMYLQQLELQSNKRLVQTAWPCGKYDYTLAHNTPLRPSGGSSWCTQLNVLPFHPHLLLMVPPGVSLKKLHPISQMSLLTNRDSVKMNYMNDSLRTDVFVRYPPETIACACIFLSARQLQVVLPGNPVWYGLMGATDDEMEDIALTILKLYTIKPKPYSELDREVEKCRVTLQAAKMKAKGLLNTEGINSAGGTPQSFSPHSNSAQNSPKVKTESPGLPNSYKVGNSIMKEESNGSTAAVKKENGKVEVVKKSSKSRSRSRSVSSVESSKSSKSRSPSKERERKVIRSSKQKEKRRKRDDSGGRHHHSRSRKRKYSRSLSRSRSRSRSRSGSFDRHHHKYHRRSPHRESRSEKHYHRDRSRSRSRSHERSGDKYRKVLKREYGRSGKDRR